MQKLSNTLKVFLAISVMIALIVMSYLNDSIFMDRILLCCFIFSVMLLARMRSGVVREVPEQKNR
jgi:hypothetical protein